MQKRKRKPNHACPTPDSSNWVPSAHRQPKADRYASARVQYSDTKE